MYLPIVFVLLTAILGAITVENNVTSKTDFDTAIAYQNGDGVSQNDFQAFVHFHQCAKRGDSKAMYKVAMDFFNGVGTDKDQVEGLAWMYNAVSSGVSSAACASMEEAIGVEQVMKAKQRAKELVSGNTAPIRVSNDQTNVGSFEDTLASLQASIKPLKNVGKNGGISDDDFQWMQHTMRKFAIKPPVKSYTMPSDPRLLNSLGVQYEKGEGISKNMNAAAEYYRKAADQSYPSAQYNLARLYQDGKGVKKSSKTAFSLFYKAASTGYAPSQISLGIAYALGQGVPKNLVRAYMWFNIAAANGTKEASKVAAKNRELAAQQMTPHQIEEAQRLSSEWSPQARPTP